MSKFLDQHRSKLAQLGEVYVDSHSPFANHSLTHYNPQDGYGFSELYEFERFCVGKGEYQLEHPLQISADLEAPAFGITILLSGNHIIKNHQLNRYYYLNSLMLLLRKGRLGIQTIYLQAHLKMSLITIDFDHSLLDKLQYSDLKNYCYQFFSNQDSTLIETYKLLNKNVLHQAQHLLNLKSVQTEIDLIHLEGVALELLSSLFRSQIKSTCSSIDQAIEIIEDHFHDKITIRSLARQIGINECDLKRLFKEQTGSTIANYILSQRMQLAQRLFIEGLSSEQVAEKIGYSSPHYFKQIFARHFGYKP